MKIAPNKTKTVIKKTKKSTNLTADPQLARLLLDFKGKTTITKSQQVSLIYNYIEPVSRRTVREPNLSSDVNKRSAPKISRGLMSSLSAGVASSVRDLAARSKHVGKGKI